MPSSDFVNDISKITESLVPQKNLVITQDNVTYPFKKVNTYKAAGSDSICGRSLRHCAHQTSEMFINNFVLSLVRFLPYGNINYNFCPEIFRPVGLNSLVMKIFDKILKDEIVSLIDGACDP